MYLTLYGRYLKIKQTGREAIVAAEMISKQALHRTKEEFKTARGKKCRDRYVAHDEIETRKNPSFIRQNNGSSNTELADVVAISWSNL